MSDVSVLISKIPQDWLHVVSYKNKNERGRMFFTRVKKEKVLRGYYMDFLLEGPSIVINHQVLLDDLHTTNKEIESVRVANYDEKSHIKVTMMEAMDLEIRQANGKMLIYNENAKAYIEALPV